ncbi:hypothetical protein HMPREF9073_02751 [Capnocytophaga sp. oral taxon 326 str. F0382]|nr:hypothetical protein HMPREF9073_02751 [Capnocytophaga sp. oral taxon 326 str. F0382]
MIFSIIEFESAKLQNNYELRGMNEEKKKKKTIQKIFVRRTFAECLYITYSKSD